MMKALLALYGGNLSEKAFETLFNNKNSILLCLEQAQKFPGVEKTVFFAPEGDFSFLKSQSHGELYIEQKKDEHDSWTKKNILEKISEHQKEFDLIFFAFADCPFLEPELTVKMTDRHLKYKADYSYADGWPYGLAPELLSPGTSGILAKISGDEGSEKPDRDMVFSILKKDINSFDIETEISNVDLRCHRINLCADTKRNLLLLKRFIEASGKIPCSADIENAILNKSEILRTLPAFYPIQVFGGCPQKCSICPYPSFADVGKRDGFMEVKQFEKLLDKIIEFSDDAVIDLSMWGELSLHPQKMNLIQAVATRAELALIIETSGIGWTNEELEQCAKISFNAGKRKNTLAAISWIVSLDTVDPKKYAELRGSGFTEAQECAKKLLKLFPKNAYIQAVRIKGAEDDTEKFYRYWKETVPSEANIIIQKYDDFCGFLEKKQASDISPVIRKPCWHLMRDFPILLDGTVPVCRENLFILNGNKDADNHENENLILGNIFNDTPESIWEKGEGFYIEQCNNKFSGVCAGCDEYYTFNF